jgi:ABC-type transport system involved in multi-copper enzyme maturation permease subunit
MTTSLTFSLFERLTPLRLAGPLLERELRVSSRRRGTYVLRTSYVAVMCLFALAAWYSIMSVPKANTASWGVSRSSLVGMRVTTQVLWFQFMAAQLIAAAMLSSSMADEMHRGGLSVLLTTPITSIQIVLGKLLSRMWQIILLLTLSLPALAVVRVMGGTSWDSLMSSFCVTLTASLFVGALCLWLSTYCRYPHQVISSAAAIYLVVFIAFPAVVVVAMSAAGSNAPLVSSIIGLVSPHSTFVAFAYPKWYFGGAGPTGFRSWPIHCLIMLGLTVTLLGHCAWRIRRVSVRTVGRAKGRRPRNARQYRCPIVWRELVGKSSRWRWGNRLLVGSAVAVCVLMVAARVLQGRRNPFYSYAHNIAWVFWTGALLGLAVLAASAIAREKEGGTLPLLLTTPLDEKRIVRGKLRAVLDRGTPWALAALAVKLCYCVCVAGWDQAWAIPCYVAAILASALFVTAAGLYFGARLRTTTTAVVAAIGAHLLICYVLIGRYNPIYSWLQIKVALAPRSSRMTMAVFGFGLFAVRIVLEAGLGLFLLRRTPGILRRYV